MQASMNQVTKITMKWQQQFFLSISVKILTKNIFSLFYLHVQEYKIHHQIKNLYQDKKKLLQAIKDIDSSDRVPWKIDDPVIFIGQSPWRAHYIFHSQSKLPYYTHSTHLIHEWDSIGTSTILMQAFQVQFWCKCSLLPYPDEIDMSVPYGLLTPKWVIFCHNWFKQWLAILPYWHQNESYFVTTALGNDLQH